MFNKRLALKAVPRAGIEPAWVAPLVFETSASTYSAIWAFCVCKVNCFFSINNYLRHFFSKFSQNMRLIGVCSELKRLFINRIARAIGYAPMCDISRLRCD